MMDGSMAALHMKMVSTSIAKTEIPFGFGIAVNMEMNTMCSNDLNMAIPYDCTIPIFASTDATNT